MYASCKCANWIKPFFWFLNTGGGANLNLVCLHLLFFFFFGWITWINQNWKNHQKKLCVKANFTENNTFYLKNLKMEFWSKETKTNSFDFLKRIVNPKVYLLSLFILWICSKPVWITILLTVAIYVHSFIPTPIICKSMGTVNCLVSLILHNVFFSVFSRGNNFT